MIQAKWLKWARHTACMREKRSAYSILLEKPKGKRLLGRCRHRWKDHVKVDIREIVMGMD
jgi:hypothetical protein